MGIRNSVQNRSRFCDRVGKEILRMVRHDGSIASNERRYVWELWTSRDANRNNVQSDLGHKGSGKGVNLY